MEKEKEGAGPIIAITIILIVIILGGVYFWNQRNVSTSFPEESENTTENSFATTTNTADIEAELNSIDTDSLDNSLYE